MKYNIALKLGGFRGLVVGLASWLLFLVACGDATTIPAPTTAVISTAATSPAASTKVISTTAATTNSDSDYPPASPTAYAAVGDIIVPPNSSRINFFGERDKNQAYEEGITVNAAVIISKENNSAIRNFYSQKMNEMGWRYDSEHSSVQNNVPVIDLHFIKLVTGRYGVAAEIYIYGPVQTPANIKDMETISDSIIGQLKPNDNVIYIRYYRHTD